ncbi:MAG: hypothetical protein NT062_36760, partial [Proteobacteria bacterium]|nr:hypothetical protein [Pseudomonadota bacterium]
GSTTSAVLKHRRRHLFFGEHHAQIRIVGRCFYIKKLDPDHAPVGMAPDPPTINQSALKPPAIHQGNCSLTTLLQGRTSPCRLCS